MIIVNQTSRTYARVSLWVRRDAGCALTRKFLTTSARIGQNGTVEGTERKQGSMTTPRGTYTITETFGNGPAPYTSMPYRETRKGDYWVGDNSSRYYNRMRNSADGGFRRSESENLRAYGAQYRYVAVINFNRPPDVQQAYRGFAIFLHVKNGEGTAGCIGITAGQMKQVLRYLRPGGQGHHPALSAGVVRTWLSRARPGSERLGLEGPVSGDEPLPAPCAGPP